ncbi:TPA: hypothetical protein ANIA_11388 [Aspergillus nidulans FGSC A4]|uniref:Uncharacterized protein n=1 Tax=Emericella nidulans (strain FGSC A4 / ATCC 38163 / CBS 112.46 / NRRL 194 / M139) TaxID=227321 RepID=C8VHW1_EMENI|nr:TPA: hypothetical protein ANIA_11388 [Aspergillus nidulans FGSC A4]
MSFLSPLVLACMPATSSS